MPDANPTFFESARAGLAKFVEKAAGRIGINLPHQPIGFIEVHEKTTELLLQAEQDKVFGIDAENSGLDNKDLEMMIGLIQKLEQLASEGEGAASESTLSLIPEEAVINRGKDNQYLVEMLGEKIKVSGKEKEIDLKEALRLAKEENQLHYTKDKKWRDPKDKEKWESMSVEDRQRIAGMRKVLGAVGLNPDSIADGNLGVTRFKYVDKKTGQEIGTEDGVRVARFEPLLVNGLVDPDTGQIFELRITDKRGPEYSGQLKEGWPEGKYITVVREGKRIILRTAPVPAKNEAIAITSQGKKIEVVIKEENESIFSKTEGDEFQEISLRQLLINITRKKQGELADAYLTALVNKGRRIGFEELGGARQIVVESLSAGAPRYETLMTALHRGGFYDKWRAIATLLEQNDRFLMLFEARNRDEAQKGLEGGRLSRLASADNIADWLEKIPDMAAALSWQEFQGFRNPKTGEPIDYPAVKLETSVRAVLQERLSNGLVKEIITAAGQTIEGKDLKAYQAKDGDIFVLKPAKTEHRSMALINVLKERAKYLGVEAYVVDLAFAFHRVMFTGQDKGISYNKAMTAGDFWQVADMFGLGEQIREDYKGLSKKDKAVFEQAITQLSIYQTGVNSFFQMVFGMRDQNTLNRDRYFRQRWKDRAPVYGDGPPEWVRRRISWANRVDWEKESVRRETYRWSGEFSQTIGKGLKDVTGRFAGAETPFNWENQHHMNALVDHLLTSETARAELERVGLDLKSLTQPRLEGLIKQIFADKTIANKAGTTNFLRELKNFDDSLGFEMAANTQATDFNQVNARFRDAVRLEKALESPAIFGNLLEFTAADGWSVNPALIEQIRGHGGIINDGSYDRMVHNQLYWYQNYLIAFDNFIRLRLGKEPDSVEKTGRKSLAQWQDQNQQDVRGTPQAFILHYLNELNELFVRSDIRDKQISHDHLNKFHEENRLWRDAVLFYQEPELDPEKYEAKVEEYCRQRMMRLHVFLDDNYKELLKKKAVGLEQVSGLVDPDGQTKMFKYAVRTAGGKIVGPGEGEGGRDTDEYLRAYNDEVAGFYYLASELDAASWFYNLDMTSEWTPQTDIQTVSKDFQGLYKFDILKVWYGVMENTVEPYHQLNAWYKQLRDLPRGDWEIKQNGEYSQIPEILVGIAREYLVYEDGRPMNLRADDSEAAAARAFFRQWLYFEDVGGYQAGYIEKFNEETKEMDRIGTPAFNKSFQILIALMLAKDVNVNGVPDNPNDPRAPRIEPTRYFYYLNYLRGLLRGSDDPGTVDRALGFYDDLMRERRVGKETWRQFFEKHHVEYMATKERIVDQMASLIRRDKMFSPVINLYGEHLRQLLGLRTNPDDPGFSMAREVETNLRELITSGNFDEVNQIMTALSGRVTAGQIPANDIRGMHDYVAHNFGLKILPWHYFVTRFFQSITPGQVRTILAAKLPQTRQARRWTFINYGIDIGDQANMPAVYQAIQDKVPYQWQDESDGESYLKALTEAREQFKGLGALKFWFGKSWLDEARFNKPHYNAAKLNLDSMNKRILLLPGDSYFGVYKQAKATAHRSMYFYQLKLIAGQLALSDADKVKMYEEMRRMVPPLKFTWELLELASDELFGFAKRPLDFNTDWSLACEYAPMPVFSALTSLIASGPGPFKAVAGLDGIMKKYFDAPWGAFPLAVAGVVLPLATMPLGWGLLTAVGGYELANVIGRIGWAWFNKRRDKAGIIERHPQIPYLIMKGIIK